MATRGRPKTKPTNTYSGFRPRLTVEADWYALQRWAGENGTSISAVFNTIIPLLKIAAQNTTEIVAGSVTIDASFGRIAIK